MTGTSNIAGLCMDGITISGDLYQQLSLEAGDHPPCSPCCTVPHQSGGTTSCVTRDRIGSAEPVRELTLGGWLKGQFRCELCFDRNRKNCAAKAADSLFHPLQSYSRKRLKCFAFLASYHATVPGGPALPVWWHFDPQHRRRTATTADILPATCRQGES